MKKQKLIRKRLLEAARVLKEEKMCYLVVWTPLFNYGIELSVIRTKYADWVADFYINGRNCGKLYLGDGIHSPFYDFT